MVLDASFLNTQHYKLRIKGKVEQSREGVAPSPTPWCSSYRKGSLRVTLDYGRQLITIIISLLKTRLTILLLLLLYYYYILLLYIAIIISEFAAYCVALRQALRIAFSFRDKLATLSPLVVLRRACCACNPIIQYRCYRCCLLTKCRKKCPTLCLV